MFFNYYLKKYGGPLLFRCNFNFRDLIVHNQFISNVCQAWSNYTFYTPTDNLLNEIIWNNSYVKINNKIVYYNFMDIKGIRLVRDVLNDDLSLMAFDDFKMKFSLAYCPFTIYFGLLSAIPRGWRQSQEVETGEVERTSLDVLNRCKSVVRPIYNKLLRSYIIEPTAIEKWSNAFNFTTREWRTIFQVPFSSVRDTKIQAFQFRLLHRILGTNYLLYVMNSENNPRCTFCGRYDETLLHLFWECLDVSNYFRY